MRTKSIYKFPLHWNLLKVFVYEDTRCISLHFAVSFFKKHFFINQRILNFRLLAGKLMKWLIKCWHANKRNSTGKYANNWQTQCDDNKDIIWTHANTVASCNTNWNYCLNSSRLDENFFLSPHKSGLQFSALETSDCWGVPTNFKLNYFCFIRLQAFYEYQPAIITGKQPVL